MTRRIALVLALTVTAAVTPAPGIAAESPALTAARRSLQEAVNRGDASGMQRARAEFIALQAGSPDSPALAYWIALCCWRAEPIVLGKDPDAARKLCKDGIAQCDRAFAADPKFGEALALKASLQGLAMTFAPGAAMSLAAEMEEGLARAATLDPANPRVAFMRALITLHKPVEVGGGPARAREEFEHAIGLFEAEKGPGRQGIQWGHDDALLWCGRCLTRLGDWEGGRARFRAALDVNPDNGWVRSALLPEAEKRLAAPSDSTSSPSTPAAPSDSL